MSPDIQQPQTAQSASLPPLATQPNFSVASQPSGSPLNVQSASLEEATSKARQLIQQYQQDPYRLSTEMQSIKGRYLAEQYHVNVVRAEDA